MASTPASRPRARPAHTKGTTRCAYTPDGTRLVTVGSNNTIRLYKTGSDGEPDNIDECPEDSTCVAAQDDFFVVGAEDGTVSLYSTRTLAFERFLLRCSLPVRDVALSPRGGGSDSAVWCAVASDELTVKLVRTDDNSKVRTLREHNKPTKHVSFDPKGGLVALSCTDGVVYVYSLTAAGGDPELIRKVDGLVGALDPAAEASSAVAWHPDGRAFAAPTPTRDVQVVSRHDWERQRAFAGGHGAGDLTALAWSPNGALLATAGRDRALLIWEARTQSVVARYDYAGLLDLAWHPTLNLAAFANADGEVFICPEFVPEQYAPLLKLPRQPAPFIHDPLSEVSGNARRQAADATNGLNGHHHDKPAGALAQRPRRLSLGSVDSFDDPTGADLLFEDDDFVVDDDGAGYTLNGNGKRAAPGAQPNGHHTGPLSKRRHFDLDPGTIPQHNSFQPGSTPWRGDRKYLCLNLVGFVWTVDQDSHHTVTVEFYDREAHRDFHFTDTFRFDKACLNEHGALFTNQPPPAAEGEGDNGGGLGSATVFYRPHETWTQRSDWRTSLPRGEAVVATSLSDSFVTVVTDRYVRIYTLFGVPYRVYRPKSTPVVTCASWKDYVMIVSNGPVAGSLTPNLVYSIENVKEDVICQSQDVVAMPDGESLQSVFFSDTGDPCIYDTTGTLLTLLHWRRSGRASWVPLLDTTLLERLASGRKTETYWPVAVADDKFHCIILKGGDRYPYFPRPLLSEFDFEVPLTSAAPPGPGAKKQKTGGGDDDDDDEQMADDAGGDADAREARRLEQLFLLSSLSAAQLRDAADAHHSSSSSSSLLLRTALARRVLDADKALLQMLALECRVGGEERGMRALDMAALLGTAAAGGRGGDAGVKMLEAAGKVAERYGRAVLGDKIRELAEQRAADADAAAPGADPFGEDPF